MDPASPPECGEGSSGPGRPRPLHPRGEPAPACPGLDPGDAIRGGDPAATTTPGSPMPPRPPHIPAAGSLPTARTIPPCHPPPTATPSPPPPERTTLIAPQKIRQISHPPTGNTPKGFPVGGCEYPHKRAVTPPHSPQTHRTHPGCLFLPRPVGEGRGEGLPVEASRFNPVASAHSNQATSHHPAPP